MAKVTGKLQITLPKAIADRCGIRVGDELDVRPLGRSIQIDSRRAVDRTPRRRDRLDLFDRATRRQRDRQAATPAARGRSRRWTREELYGRGRSG